MKTVEDMEAPEKLQPRCDAAAAAVGHRAGKDLPPGPTSGLFCSGRLPEQRAGPGSR